MLAYRLSRLIAPLQWTLAEFRHNLLPVAPPKREEKNENRLHATLPHFADFPWAEMRRACILRQLGGCASTAPKLPLGGSSPLRRELGFAVGHCRVYCMLFSSYLELTSSFIRKKFISSMLINGLQRRDPSRRLPPPIVAAHHGNSQLRHRPRLTPTRMMPSHSPNSYAP